MPSKTKKTSEKPRKYDVEVCYGGCFALWPTGQPLKFIEIGECRNAIAVDGYDIGCSSTIPKKVVRWTYGNTVIEETITAKAVRNK